MAEVELPAWKKQQREARAKVKSLPRVIAVSGVELGIKAYKRANPGRRYLFADYKRNAWASYDPSKVHARHTPTKFEPPAPKEYPLPEGLSNRQRHHMRRAIRQQIKEAEL